MAAAWWARRRRAGDDATKVDGAAAPTWRRGVAWEVGVAVIALTPFLVLQLVCNKGITGRWFEMPWTYWSARNDPYDTISVAPVPPGVPHQPQSAVPRTAAFSESETRAKYEAKVRMSPAGRLVERGIKPVLHWGLSDPLLLVLVPVGLLGLGSRRRWVLVAMLPLFVYVHARHTYFIMHYVTSVAPALILLVLAGSDSIAGLWGRTGATAVRVAGGAAIAALAVAALPQVRGDYESDEWDVAPLFRMIDDRIENGVRPPAVVLFHAEPGRVNFHIEPTYNVDVAWPDDAPVVRAHDLGPERNRQLYAYYSALSRRRGEPERGVYLYDLSLGTMGLPPKYLGTAAELAAGK
jgi:hypothetical protein